MKHIYVPKYESLTVKEILKKASEHQDFEKYLPQEKEISLLPR